VSGNGPLIAHFIDSPQRCGASAVKGEPDARRPLPVPDSAEVASNRLPFI